MSLLISESFDTGIPSGFATNPGYQGTMTVTYNAAQKAVDIAASSMSGWLFSNIAASSDFSLEIDIELISGTSGAIGLYLLDSPLVNYGANTSIAQEVGTSSGNYSGVYYANSGNNWNFGGAALIRPTFNSWLYTNERRTLKFFSGAFPSYGSNARIYGIAKGNTPYWAYIRDNPRPSVNSFFPALSIYACTVRIHSINLWNDISYISSAISNKNRADAFKKFTASPVSDTSKIKIGNSGTVATRRRIERSGSSSITGIVTVNGVPSARLVRLHERTTGLIMAEAWSNSQGVYTFTNIDPTIEYYEVAFDHLTGYNMVGRDKIVIGRS